MTNIYKGIVQKGKRRGTALGFPTVNIALEDAEVSGVYAAKVRIGDTEYQAAAFADPGRKLLEAHLLDFLAQGGSALGRSGDLYGKSVEIELFEKIRKNTRFPDDAALRAAIAEDVRRVCILHNTRA